jgi:hypothetical protein
MMITFGLSITFRLDRFPAGGGLADPTWATFLTSEW